MKEKEFLNVTLADIQRARLELQKYLPPTPLVLNSWLSEAYACEVYLKLENMQPIGSFKIRGATYKISRLSQVQRKRGIIAASAGNHAQGVAWGSRKHRVNALVVMPIYAPRVKIQNTRALGAEVILYGKNYDESYSHACELAKESDRVFVHAFEDEEIISGQGTIGLEILEQLPDVDWVVGSVGGGGMMAGISIGMKALRPQTMMVGCQAAGAPSMVRSIRKGQAIVLKQAHTFADGIAVIQASEKMRRLLSSPVKTPQKGIRAQTHINDWVEVDEDSIVAAVFALLKRAKLVTEGAGAVPLAALSSIQKKVRGKKVVLVMSGGNLDFDVLSRIIKSGDSSLRNDE